MLKISKFCILRNLGVDMGIFLFLKQNRIKSKEKTKTKTM